MRAPRPLKPPQRDVPSRCGTVPDTRRALHDIGPIPRPDADIWRFTDAVAMDGEPTGRPAHIAGVESDERPPAIGPSPLRPHSVLPKATDRDSDARPAAVTR